MRLTRGVDLSRRRVEAGSGRDTAVLWPILYHRHHSFPVSSWPLLADVHPQSTCHDDDRPPLESSSIVVIIKGGRRGRGGGCRSGERDDDGKEGGVCRWQMKQPTSHSLPFQISVVLSSPPSNILARARTHIYRHIHSRARNRGGRGFLSFVTANSRSPFTYHTPCHVGPWDRRRPASFKLSDWSVSTLSSTDALIDPLSNHFELSSPLFLPFLFSAFSSSLLIHSCSFLLTETMRHFCYAFRLALKNSLLQQGIINTYQSCTFENNWNLRHIRFIFSMNSVLVKYLKIYIDWNVVTINIYL